MPGNHISGQEAEAGAPLAAVGPAALADGSDLTLGAAPPGLCGRILGLRPLSSGGLSAEELERRLLELGFVEGARVEILHQGLFRRDPIAVRVQAATIALRRREAAAVVVEALA